jgi:hypothetical protein
MRRQPAAEYVSVRRNVALNHVRQVVLASRSPGSAVTELSRPMWIAQQTIERSRKRGRVSGIDENSRVAVSEGRPDVANGTRHDGAAGKHGLEEREGQSFR